MMQTQTAQSITDQIEIMGLVDGVSLRATCHRADDQMAKAILAQLHAADKSRSWDLNIQSDAIQFWCDLSPTYGYKMASKELSKGYRNVKLRGQELVARIKAGCDVRA
jgi:hypothetical protein